MAIEITDNLIQGLLEVDPNFMYKFDVIKDKLASNLNDYAKKIKNMIPENMHGKGKGGFADDLKSKINSSIGGSKGQEGTFAEKAISVLIDGFSDQAAKQISDIMGVASGGVKTETTIKKSGTSEILGAIGSRILGGLGMDKETNIKKSGTSGILGTIGSSILVGLGMGKAPAFISTLAKGAGAMAPVIMIAGGLIWAAVDGIRGFLKADKWGTTKVSGALGGVLGGTDKGLKGAAKNMGKWALIGARIGSIVPAVGTLAGGLIGAAIGGILGWIGGERLAKAFDKIGVWFNEKFGVVIDFFRDLLGGFKDGFFEGIGYFFGKLAEKLRNFFNKVDEVFDNIGNFFGRLTEKIQEFAIGLWNNVVEVFDNIINFFGRLTEKLKNFFNNPEKIKEFAIGLWNNLVEVLDNIGNYLADFIKNAWAKIKKGFKKGKEDEVREMMDSTLNEEAQRRVAEANAKPAEIIFTPYPNTNEELLSALTKANDLTEQQLTANQLAEKRRREAEKSQEQLLKAMLDNKSQVNPIPAIPFNFSDMRDPAYDHRTNYYRGE